MTVNLAEVCIQDSSAPEDDSTRQNEAGVRATAYIDSRQIFLAAQVGCRCITPGCRETNLHSQLGCLASQHHASEYNCQKYGLKGMLIWSLPFVVSQVLCTRGTFSLCTAVASVP